VQWLLAAPKAQHIKHLPCYLHREIADIGHSRASFVDAYIANIVAELDANDATAASPVNANLVGSV